MSKLIFCFYGCICLSTVDSIVGCRNRDTGMFHFSYTDDTRWPCACLEVNKGARPVNVYIPCVTTSQSDQLTICPTVFVKRSMLSSEHHVKESMWLTRNNSEAIWCIYCFLDCVLCYGEIQIKLMAYIFILVPRIYLRPPRSFEVAFDFVASG